MWNPVAAVAAIILHLLHVLDERMIRQVSGESIWHNVCLSMYKTEPLFDALLRPALGNSMVVSLRFVLDESQKPLWEEFIQP